MHPLLVILRFSSKAIMQRTWNRFRSLGPHKLPIDIGCPGCLSRGSLEHCGEYESWCRSGVERSAFQDRALSLSTVLLMEDVPFWRRQARPFGSKYARFSRGAVSQGQGQGLFPLLSLVY